MIYIIGVDHKIQHGGLLGQTFGQANESQRSLFVTYLEDIIKKYNIGIVVEESNEDVLKRCMAENSVAQVAANKLELDHVFAEPTMRERKELGILKYSEICELLGIDSTALNKEDNRKLKEWEEKYFSIREDFWFEKIATLKHKEVLMIIGAEHTSTFPKILKKYDFDCKIINQNWCFENEGVLNNLGD